MTASAREMWLLAFYRNSELHGALLMGRLARSYDDASLAAHLTRHCATEARHAAMLTDALAALGGRIDLETGTIQGRYGEAGGIPTELADLLALSEILEKRVLASYRDHLARRDVSPIARQTLEAIVSEMEREEDGTDPHAGWIDQALDRMPPEAVAAAKERWQGVDAQVAAGLLQWLDERFAAESRS
jgi:bacterioferritin (cytochrome b1)